MRGFLIAAPQSRSGKTTVTLGLLRALTGKGQTVAPAKAGPDFIDPAFHEAASGQPCVNLDAWAMRPELVSALAARACKGDRLLVVEGAMGLFDGAADGTGSAADVAAQLALPVILVVDCARQSQSIAALVRGFRDHRADTVIAGLILNNTGSSRHEDMLRRALDPLAIPVLGCLIRDPMLELPERHLGLVQAAEHQALEAFISRAADTIGQAVDLDAVLDIGSQCAGRASAGGVARIRPLGRNMAIARDAAFSFIYPHLVDGWIREGVKITYFSPLADETPEPGSDAIFLPGGYPELHADKLAAAKACRTALHEFAANGAVIYGECGGYMAMGEAMTDAGGVRREMFGLLPLETSFAERRRHLGYRQLAAFPGAPLSGKFRGHEFHYATVIREDGADRLFSATDAFGRKCRDSGLRRGNVCGSFMHLIDMVD